MGPGFRGVQRLRGCESRRERPAPLGEFSTNLLSGRAESLCFFGASAGSASTIAPAGVGRKLAAGRPSAAASARSRRGPRSVSPFASVGTTRRHAALRTSSSIVSGLHNYRRTRIRAGNRREALHDSATVGPWRHACKHRGAVWPARDALRVGYAS